MMGLRMPKKLPSRNWMIFFAITGSFTSAIIYDRREKDRATKRWAKSISHLAKEPVGNPSQLPRKLTVYLEAPPGDSLRISQEHYKEYVKPILAQSGLEWDFVQGRAEGDIRAAVAERIRRERRKQLGEEIPPTDFDVIEQIRREKKIPQYEGTLGDIVIGRQTWKEYIRGVHEGWLGPLEQPYNEASKQIQAKENPPTGEISAGDSVSVTGEVSSERPQEPSPKDEQPEQQRPRQPPPYNTPDSYEVSQLPPNAPLEFPPVVAIPHPFILGFTRTPKRVWRYLHRRELADEIGRQVAAAVLASYREFREDNCHEGGSTSRYEQQALLESEEDCWVKSVWKNKEGDDEKAKENSDLTLEREKIWTKPIVIDQRIAERMRRFEVQSEDEERAKTAVVKEEEIEGFLKGSIRSMWRWAAVSFKKEEPKPIPLDDKIS